LENSTGTEKLLAINKPHPALLVNQTL